MESRERFFTATDALRSHTHRRRVVLGVVTLVVLVLGGGAWLVSKVFVSPAERAASAEPPSPSLIVGEVTRQVIAEVLVVRGEAVARRSLALGAENFQQNPAVLTRNPARAGSSLRSGDVVAEVSGQPMFVLQGELPPYRDLALGDSGPDAQQLNIALKAIGVLPANAGAVDRVTAATARAIEQLYERNGYPSPGPQRIVLRTSDVAFLPQLPAVISSSVGVRGDVLDGTTSFMTLQSGAASLTGYLQEGQQQLVNVDQSVELLEDGSGTEASGTVTRVADALSYSDDGTALGYKFVVRPRAPLPARLIGTDWRITLTTASTKEPVLAVPLAAVTVTGDGDYVVEKIDGDERSLIRVDVGATAGGFAELKETSVDLQAGDQVLLGTGTAG